MALQHGDRVLDLVDHVKRIGVARVGEDDVDQGRGQVVAVVRGALERVAEVGGRVGDVVEVATEDDEAGDGDEDEGDDLDGADDIGGPEGVLVVSDDADDGEGVGGDGNTFELPGGRGLPGDSPEVPGQNYKLLALVKVPSSLPRMSRRTYQWHYCC